MIASAVGKPITFDGPTAKLEPMKFARVLVELQYSTPRPTCVWVPVISDIDGTVLRVKVDIEFAQVPSSCSLCKAFGHALSKCPNNLDATPPSSALKQMPNEDSLHTSAMGPNIVQTPKQLSKGTGDAAVTADEQTILSTIPTTDVQLGSQRDSGLVLQDITNVASHDKETLQFDELEDLNEHIAVSNEEQRGPFIVLSLPASNAPLQAVSPKSEMKKAEVVTNIPVLRS